MIKQYFKILGLISLLALDALAVGSTFFITTALQAIVLFVSLPALLLLNVKVTKEIEKSTL